MPGYFVTRKVISITEVCTWVFFVLFVFPFLQLLQKYETALHILKVSHYSQLSFKQLSLVQEKVVAL